MGRGIALYVAVSILPPRHTMIQREENVMNYVWIRVFVYGNTCRGVRHKHKRNSVLHTLAL